MLKDAPTRHVAVRVVFVQYDREKYRGALERLVSHLESLQELDYEVLVVDNARQGSWSHRASRRVLHIGGDNSAWEFSAFDRALALLDASHADCDAFVFVTDAFGAYGETFLELVKRDTFDRAVADNACIGWVDAWPAPCLLFGKEDNEWLRTSFLLMPERVVANIRPFAVPIDAAAVFTGDKDKPLSPNGPLSESLKTYLTDWLLAGQSAQSLSEAWHSRFELTDASLAFFQNKVCAILREHLLSARIREGRGPVYDFRLFDLLDGQGVRWAELSTAVRASFEWGRWSNVGRRSPRGHVRSHIDLQRLPPPTYQGDPALVLLEGWVLVEPQPKSLILQTPSGNAIVADCRREREDVLRAFPADGVLEAGFRFEDAFRDLPPGEHELSLLTDAGDLVSSVGRIRVLPRMSFTVRRMLLPHAWSEAAGAPILLDGELTTSERAETATLWVDGQKTDVVVSLEAGALDERGVWVSQVGLNARLSPSFSGGSHLIELRFELTGGGAYRWMQRLVCARRADLPNCLHKLAMGPHEPETSLTVVRLEVDILDVEPSDRLILSRGGVDVLDVPLTSVETFGGCMRTASVKLERRVEGIPPGVGLFELAVRRDVRRLRIWQGARLVRRERPQVGLEKLDVVLSEDTLRHRILLRGWIENHFLVDCLIIEVDGRQAGIVGLFELRPDRANVPETQSQSRQRFDVVVEIAAISPGEHEIHVLATQQNAETARVERRVVFPDAPARRASIISEDLERLLRRQQKQFYSGIALSGILRTTDEETTLSILLDDRLLDEQSFNGSGEHSFRLRGAPETSGDYALRCTVTSRGKLVFATEPVQIHFRCIDLPERFEHTVSAILDRFELRTKIVGMGSDREVARRLVELQAERLPEFIKMLDSVGERVAQEDVRRSRLPGVSLEQPGQALKVLFVSWEVPSRYHGGGVYLRNLLGMLGRRHEITLVHTYGSDEAGHVDGVRRYVKKVISVPRTHRIAAFRGGGLLPSSFYDAYVQELRRIVELEVSSGGYDLVDYEYSALGPYIVGGPPSLLCSHEVGYMAFLNSYFDKAHPLETAAPYLDQFLRMFHYETVELPKMCPNLVTLTEEDARALTAFRPDLRAFTSPTGVDVEYFAQTRIARNADEAPVFVYNGNFQSPSNLRAVRFFAGEVMPLIRQQHPGAEFKILGCRIPPEIRDLDGANGISVVGFVDDLRPWFGGATAFVAPIFTGTGMRVKVLEALAAGALVIGTPLSVQGLPVVDGEHVLLAHSASAFFDAACRAIARPDEARAIAERGRELVVSEYSWEQAALRREAIWHEVTRTGHGVRLAPVAAFDAAGSQGRLT